MLKLVIIIPTKNRQALLERALGSVFSQKFEDYRVVVVNDGSTDGTRAYLNSLKNPRVTVVHHEKSRGVRAGYNAGLRTLIEGEWGVPLDDDDLFLPNAFQTIAQTIKTMPDRIQIIWFNTITRTASGEHETGRIFEKGEEWYEPTYYEFFKDSKHNGESRVAYRWTLYPRYLFLEDINGFEGEHLLLYGRDNLGVKHVRQQIILIDASHGGEQLSNVAARRDPAGFARAHQRIFRDHKKFFVEHPEIALERAPGAMKLAVRAFAPFAFVQFAAEYVQALYRLRRKRFKKKPEPK